MDRELIEKFIEVTGENEATAQQYLALADGNVEVAISLMFEGGRAAEPAHVEPEPEVRPPILPIQEVLVPPEPVCSFPRLSDSVFDRFRDFAVETQRQEEEMTRRVTGVRQISQRKSKRLEDLFRPPCNILFLGSFLEVREHAKTLNRWLLVNVQNPQEFACQVLNRDVWPNQQIQEIVKDHFVLWQVLSNTTDGKRYIDFYNVTKYPYLAIVDPRTGECMRTYNHITIDSLISSLNDMLSTHASPECAPQDPISNSKEWADTTAASARNSLPESVKNDCSSNSSSSSSSSSSICSSSSSGNGKISRHLGEKLPDSDSNNKVPNSTTNSNIPSSSLSIINKRRRSDELDKSVKKRHEDTIPQNEPSKTPGTKKTETGDEPFLRLCLRLPNGGKETISMCATNNIEDFLNKMEDMGFPPSEHTYLVPFPKTNIGALSPNTRLLDTILFPSNTVFITKI